MPADRLAKGKSEHGTITLVASHQGGSIVIEVRDDGKGLNRAKLLSKARERGLDAPDSMTDQEVYSLIFAPGFSTADQVTDVSGRGVGMDVVKKNIMRAAWSTSTRLKGGMSGQGPLCRRTRRLRWTACRSVGARSVSRPCRRWSSRSRSNSGTIKTSSWQRPAWSRCVYPAAAGVLSPEQAATCRRASATERRRHHGRSRPKAAWSPLSLLVDGAARPAAGGGEEPGSQLPQNTPRRRAPPSWATAGWRRSSTWAAWCVVRGTEHRDTVNRSKS
jgi:hypothetical protein